MNFDLSEDQALLKAAAERFVVDAYPDTVGDRRRARLTPAGFSAANWARLADSGMLALPVSAARGGLGGGRVELMVVLEALGAGLVAEPLIDAALVPAALLDHDFAQQSAVLEGVIAGARHIALAHAEREARFRAAHVATTARRRGENVIIDGSKTAVMSGGNADSFIVSAREAGATTAADGISLWLVDAAAPGVDRRSYRLADGSAAAEITLRNVTVSAADEIPGGFASLQQVIARGRFAAAAEMLGVMTRLFETTLSYVKTRHQFGQPLGAFQVIQHRMTDAYVLTEQARSQVVRAALVADGEFARAAAGAKAFVSEAALSVAHTAVQMHGGMGITDELVIGHGLKRLRVLALTFGDSSCALDDYRDAA